MTTTELTAGTWKLDPAHSELTFSVRHLAISKVRGSFEKFDVTIVTAEDPTKSTVEATVDVASVTTNNEQRDGHLQSGDFFLTEEYPTMTFTSTSVAATGADFTIVGDLTLRGVTKTITLTGEFGGVATDGSGQTKAGASASTKINRKEFGVEWNSPVDGGLMLGDEISINVELQVVLQK
jgi:polyisoprenoid-binding protein YceI